MLQYQCRCLYKALSSTLNIWRSVHRLTNVGGICYDGKEIGFGMVRNVRWSWSKSANRRLWQAEISRLENMGFTIKAKPTNRRSEFYCTIDWRNPEDGTIAKKMFEIAEHTISTQSWTVSPQTLNLSNKYNPL